MKKISLLGATGSIGTQTLEVLRAHPEKLSLVALSLGRNISLGLSIINEFKPKLVCVLEQEDAKNLQELAPSGTKIIFGEEGLVEVATYHEADTVVNAVIGSVGLLPTLAAIRERKNVAIANKETLVTAGHLVMGEANKYGVNLLPVDSEHSAIFQCLNGDRNNDISRLILTASGGSFRDKTREELQGVTIEDALNHPNWSMGAKITIDSATMMNKGLEVIEAHWLFNMPYEKIDVLLHKESIIHSLVEFSDNSVLAQLGTPDMKVPIQYALTYPNRYNVENSEQLQLWQLGTLHFEKMDVNRFKCLDFAFEAGRIGGTMPTVLNAANEIAVDRFLKGEISFLAIEELIERAMEMHNVLPHPSLELIQEVDQKTRERVRSLQI
ncbi:1-deoxy-D-xylulose-5-phosphate reductoisomerase [Lottiidibacillus patelloidae]|uniref:1-deoxy-D-xylulose 5-phosphate reductoisomerase n=1 Tax=Lottiidibacillus patelloidae TaxID=2670334 RepID=A0A263BZM6_9BACI|nr:1-deoxy-D-xylulose-5-phosphate reductoisomerase [Lottiidibacillus patelloidae]OZM58606.1 1-deoxy-D-xylulose-5-phosphate reductoisomerase [Lottiidibacillus patelloidae]